MQVVRKWLAHPLTRGLDLDDPKTTALRRLILAEKPFLQAIYLEWYRSIVAALPDGAGMVLELGSGPGFFAEVFPGVLTSEVFRCPDVAAVLDGQQLPLADGSLRAIVMTNVLHHIPNVRCFLSEAERCLRPGGAIVMIEPWVTAWSRLVYTRLHHEPFDPDVQIWELPAGGPLSEANGALPWILCQRDRTQLEGEFALLQIANVTPCMPFSYLVSGGISMRNLAPAWSFNLWRALETAMLSWMNQLGMFAKIVIVRREGTRGTR